MNVLSADLGNRRFYVVPPRRVVMNRYPWTTRKMGKLRAIQWKHKRLQCSLHPSWPIQEKRLRRELRVLGVTLAEHYDMLRDQERSEYEGNW